MPKEVEKLKIRDLETEDFMESEELDFTLVLICCCSVSIAVSCCGVGNICQLPIFGGCVMRTNVTLASSDGITYVKSGEKLFELTGIPVLEVDKLWREVVNGNLQSPEGSNKRKLVDFLGGIGAFDSSDTLFQPRVLDSGEELHDRAKTVIGVLGDSDLIGLIGKGYEQIEVLPLSEKDLESGIQYDYGLIISRKYNVKRWLKFNTLFFSTGKPFFGLLLEGMSCVIGPQVIPHQTACLCCMRDHELRNNNFGKVLQIFDNIEANSTEFVLPNLVHLSVQLIFLQIIKLDLQRRSLTIIRPELVQSFYSYNFVDGFWNEHALFKSLSCPLCFPGSVFDDQTYEVIPK